MSGTFSHIMPSFFVQDQFLNIVRKILVVILRRKIASFPFNNRLWNPPTSKGYNWKSASLGLTSNNTLGLSSSGFIVSRGH